MAGTSRVATRHVQLADLSGPVRFRGADDLIEAIRAILPSWPIREVERPDRRPLLRVSRTRSGAYRRVSPRHRTPSSVREKTRRGLVPALCGFHFELIDWWCEEHPEQLFLHAAAVAWRDRLVLMPAVQRAGKSTLCLYLAMQGARLYGDDVVPIATATGEGVALGVLPRLRQARPGAETQAFRAFVGERKVLATEDRIYVDPGPRLLAPLGERSPVGAVVLLDRRPRGAARLEPVDPADALETIILQNFAREVPTPTVLDTLHAVVSKASCHRLRFSRSGTAAEALRKAFA
jgi:hypothetical protein